MNENENEWLSYKIDGYPNYVIHSDGLRVKVISFHYSKTGKERCAEFEYDYTTGKVYDSGYILYNNGKKKYFLISELIAYYFKQKVKNQRNELQAQIDEKEKQMGFRNYGVQSGRFIVGSLTKSSNEFSATSDPVGHMTHSSANIEAERLAGLYPQKKFVVLEVKGIVSKGDAVWQ